jgi:calnexin
MQNDILFDNIYIGHSVEDANKLAEESFKEKHAIEQLAELADKPKEEEKPKSPSDLKFMDDPVHYIKEKLDLFLAIAQTDPIQAIKFVPEIAGGIGAILVTLVAIIAGIVSIAGGSAPPAVKKAAADAKDKAKDVKDTATKAVASGAEAAKADATKRTTRSQQS